MNYQFKGTPAPWIAVAPTEHKISSRGNDITMMSVQTEKTRHELNAGGATYRDDPHNVSNVIICDKFIEDLSFDELVANCHLLAAAPDLLNACLMALMACEEDMNPEVVFIMTAAIHKALNIK
ncbi:hypothetical protein ACTJJB_01680 [Chitinophaga sp. 22536]|uniref:hypothetical protein n=1 Tax=unclassified Chitinophaga TaxID=2619133 RepID=UPI003F843922